MDAGAYRHKVIIQHRTVVKDNDGFQSEIWEDCYSNYAYINNLSGNERWAAAQVQMDRAVRFTFRYHKGLNEVKPEKYRIKWGSRIFTVTFVDNVKYLNETVKIDTLEVE